MRISDWSSDVCSFDLARKRSVDLRRNRALRLIPKAPLLGTKEGDAVIPMQRVDQGHGFAQGPMGHGGRLRRRGQDFGEHLPVPRQHLRVVLAEKMRRPADQHPLLVLRSAEHTSELQSLMRSSYAVFCLEQQT